MPCRYDFRTTHAAAKQLGATIDEFMYGVQPLGLLLWWGDLAAMRAGVKKVLDAHRRVLTFVTEGEATADRCAAHGEVARSI